MFPQASTCLVYMFSILASLFPSVSDRFLWVSKCALSVSDLCSMSFDVCPGCLNMCVLMLYMFCLACFVNLFFSIVSLGFFVFLGFDVCSMRFYKFSLGSLIVVYTCISVFIRFLYRSIRFLHLLSVSCSFLDACYMSSAFVSYLFSTGSEWIFMDCNLFAICFCLSSVRFELPETDSTAVSCQPRCIHYINGYLNMYPLLPKKK
jgi:hypothetical protein